MVLGNFAANPALADLLADADALLSIGTHFRSNETKTYRLGLPAAHVQLDVDPAAQHWKSQHLDLSPIFQVGDHGDDAPRRRTREQDHGLDKALDNTMIQLAEGALRSGDQVTLDLPVRNVNRTVGTMLGSELTRVHGGNVHTARRITPQVQLLWWVVARNRGRARSRWRTTASCF